MSGENQLVTRRWLSVGPVCGDRFHERHRNDHSYSRCPPHCVTRTLPPPEISGRFIPMNAANDAVEVEVSCLTLPSGRLTLRVGGPRVRICIRPILGTADCFGGTLVVASPLLARSDTVRGIASNASIQSRAVDRFDGFDAICAKSPSSSRRVIRICRRTPRVRVIAIPAGRRTPLSRVSRRLST